MAFLLFLPSCVADRIDHCFQELPGVVNWVLLGRSIVGGDVKPFRLLIPWARRKSKQVFRGNIDIFCSSKRLYINVLKNPLNLVGTFYEVQQPFIRATAVVSGVWLPIGVTPPSFLLCTFLTILGQQRSILSRIENVECKQYVCTNTIVVVLCLVCFVFALGHRLCFCNRKRRCIYQRTCEPGGAVYEGHAKGHPLVGRRSPIRTY